MNDLQPKNSLGLREAYHLPQNVDYGLPTNIQLIPIRAKGCSKQHPYELPPSRQRETRPKPKAVSLVSAPSPSARVAREVLSYEQEGAALRGKKVSLETKMLP